MKAKHLLPLLTVFTLVGCNKNMTVINDDKAKEIVAGILKRQDDKQLFQEPTTLTYKNSSKTIQKGKYSDGDFKSTKEDSYELLIDVKSMKSISKIIEKDNTKESKVEIIRFFDTNTSILYTLNNHNGYKTKSIDSSYKSESDVKDLFANYLKLTGYLNRSQYLNDFATTLENYKTQHERYINENDQHYNYTFGSNDAKSFQEILDIKTKIVGVGTPAFNGYHTKTSNMIMKSDRLESITTVEKNDTKADKASFYEYDETTTKDEYSYDAVTINIPSLDEYETVESY